MLEVTHISQKVKHIANEIIAAREYNLVDANGVRDFVLIPRLGNEFLTGFAKKEVMFLTKHEHTVQSGAYLILALLESYIGMDYFAHYGSGTWNDAALAAARIIIQFIETVEGENVANRVKDLEERFASDEEEKEARAVCMTEHPLPEPRSAAEPF